MSTFYNNVVKIIIAAGLIALLAIALGFLDVSGALAYGHDTGRSDACRTYNVNFIFEGTENEDNRQCGASAVVNNDSDDDSGVSDDDTQTIIDEGGIDIPSNDDSDDDSDDGSNDSDDGSNDGSNDDSDDGSNDDSDDGSNDTDKNKKQCNNGEGNGGENCSPAKSDNANNDENSTTPKEDKSNKPLKSGAYLLPLVAMTVKFLSRGKVYKFRNVHSFQYNTETKMTWVFYYKYDGRDEDDNSTFSLEFAYTDKNVKVIDSYAQSDLYTHIYQLQNFSKPDNG